jgi:hypothetical protein
MGLLVRGYQQLAGEHVNVISPGYLWPGRKGRSGKAEVSP